MVQTDRSTARYAPSFAAAFYLPLMPEDPEESVWSVIRKLADKIGEQLTTHLRDIAKEKPSNPASSSPPGISAGVLFPGK